MAKYVELRRHTDSDGDVLSETGVRDAIELGGELAYDYALAVSTGAQRATQTVACLLAGLGRPVAGGVVVEARLRSEHEDRWRALVRQAGSGALDVLCEADPDFVAGEATRLADGLCAIFAGLPEGGRALVVGHSPTNEAAVYGLTGVIVALFAKGDGVLVSDTDGSYDVVPLGSAQSG